VKIHEKPLIRIAPQRGFQKAISSKNKKNWGEDGNPPPLKKLGEDGGNPS